MAASGEVLRELHDIQMFWIPADSGWRYPEKSQSLRFITGGSAFFFPLPPGDGLGKEKHDTPSRPPL
jgi:hypothetical protein